MRSRASGAWGKLTTSTLAAFVPEGSYRSGKVWRVETDADLLRLRPNLAAEGPGHDQWGGRNHTRAYWSPGRGDAMEDARLRRALRRNDTDRTRANCPFLPKTCGPEVVGTLTVNLPPLMF